MYICNGLPYPPPHCYTLWLPIMLMNNGLFSFCSSLCLHSASWILGQLSQLRFPSEFVGHAFVWSPVLYMLRGIFCNIYFAFAIMYLACSHCVGSTFALYCAARLLQWSLASRLTGQVTHQRLHTGVKCLFSPMFRKCIKFWNFLGRGHHTGKYTIMHHQTLQLCHTLGSGTWVRQQSY